MLIGMREYTTTSERLYLEPLTLAHLEQFHELWTDAEAVKWTTRIPKKSIEETAAWMPTILTSEDQPDIDKWAVFLKSPSSQHQSIQLPSSKRPFIGIIGTNRWSDQGMETGYCLHKTFWGQGYATEAFTAFLKMYWAIEEREEIKHLVAKVYPGNEQSVKVLRKCGGREGEVLRKETLRGGLGEVGDMCCWYLDRPGTKAS